MIEKIHKQAFGLISRDALFSPDMRYRYRLREVWEASLPLACFIGLNPSTADELKDDPTIRRVRSFAQRWKMGGWVMLNLFAFRATDPGLLPASEDAIGPENSIEFLAIEAIKCRSTPIAAWGTLKKWQIRREAEVCGLEKMECLGFTKESFPRHPLYVRGDTELVEFPKNDRSQSNTV